MKKVVICHHPLEKVEIRHLVTALVNASCTLKCNELPSFKKLKPNRKARLLQPKHKLNERPQTPFDQLRKKNEEAERFDYEAEALRRHASRDSTRNGNSRDSFTRVTQENHSKQNMKKNSKWWERLNENQFTKKLAGSSYLQHYQRKEHQTKGKKERTIIRQNLLEVALDNPIPIDVHMDSNKHINKQSKVDIKLKDLGEL